LDNFFFSFSCVVVGGYLRTSRDVEFLLRSFFYSEL
jgi:hypothetical protein